jgi:hypothetical protein
MNDANSINIFRAHLDQLDAMRRRVRRKPRTQTIHEKYFGETTKQKIIGGNMRCDFDEVASLIKD